MTNPCDGCPLQGTTTPAVASGSVLARFVVVTDTPTTAARRANRLMSENSAQIFSKAVRAVGFSRDDFTYMPAIRCPHDVDAYSTKEKGAIRDHCRDYVVEYIRRVKPEAVIPLGALPARQALGRALKITKVRGVCEYSEELETNVFPLLSPGMVGMYPQHQTTFDSDCATLQGLCDASFNVEVYSNNVKGRYEFIDDLEFLVEKNAPILFFDTENTGLSHFQKGEYDVRDYRPENRKGFTCDAAVLTMQFCVEPGVAYMLVWDHPERPVPMRRKKVLKDQLRRLLNNPKTRVVGQNAKYDRTYVEGVLGVYYPMGGDTLMLATMLDENSIAKGQDMLVRQYVPEMAGYADQFNANTDKSKMWEVPLDRLLDYGCGDVDSGYLLYKALIRIIMADEGLLKHYRYAALPGLNAFAAMELRGLVVDEEALGEFEAFMSETVDEQYAELIAEVPKSIKRLHIDKGLKFSRGDFVRDILFYHKDGFRLRPKVFTKTTAKLQASQRIPSTSSKDHLPYFYEECPFTERFSEYVKNERLLNTSVRGFQKKYIIDGLVRSTYRLDNVVTGRSASENPNGQNYPKRSKLATAYRRAFVAPPGYIVLEADLSQAELRIAADYANEPTMLRIYRNNGDIHKETALIVLGVSMAVFRELPKDEQKSARQKAKAVNFGFLYGMGWRKFIGYAKTQYGVEFSEEEAQRIRTAFFHKYSALPAWHEQCRRTAQRDKQIRSYSGRIRHLPMIDSDDEMVQQEAGRQAINSGVQEFGSTLGVMALGRIEKEIDPIYLAPVAFVHDAIYCYVPEEYAEWGAKTLKRYMESNPIEKWFGVRMKCPIVADVSFGRNLGDTYEMEGLNFQDDFDFSKVFEGVEDEGKIIHLPEQLVPPNYGRLDK